VAPAADPPVDAPDFEGRTGRGYDAPAPPAFDAPTSLVRSFVAPSGGRIARATARAAAQHAPAPAPVPEPERRPHLTLVQAPAEPAPSPAPRQIARTSAERLAEVTGGAIAQGEGGLRAVSFPAPGSQAAPQPPYIAPFSTEPVTVARAITEAPAESSPATAHMPTDHPPSGEPKVDVDALYDEFLDRFKRDLLVEREQSGHLLIDNP
jgi:hypothetical protein